MLAKAADSKILSMAGHLSASSEADDAELSCLLEDLLEGKFLVIIGHPESFDSKLGQRILRELQRRGLIVLICIDEFHQGGSGHWDSFRSSVKRDVLLSNVGS